MGSRPNHHAFEQRLKEHRRLVAKVASVYAAGAEDRRDLEQEISVQLWRPVECSVQSSLQKAR